MMLATRHRYQKLAACVGTTQPQGFQCHGTVPIETEETRQVSVQTGVSDSMMDTIPPFDQDEYLRMAGDISDYMIWDGSFRLETNQGETDWLYL